MSRPVGIRFRFRSHPKEGNNQPVGLPLSTIVHGSAVAFAGRGLLILGMSGSGKSALALALVGRGGQLVADDRVVIERRGAALVASAPQAIAGLIEARGVGLLRLPAVPEAALVLAVDLDQPVAARMPQPVAITLLGASLELISGKHLPNLDLVLSMIVQTGRASPT
ncbi:MAG: HPr kinase/phosphatase C-terminal domain-containing protein [Amaricoccus sp.]|uniref:HPr kinase/phosphorylase n=1 Tax=Amaricoccus sp. TaxID=1872485 RepID=UPI0039E5312D